MSELKLRVSVINATGEQWEIIDTLENDGIISIDPEKLFDLVGFFGGLTALYNDDDKKYRDRFNYVARRKRCKECHQEGMKPSHDGSKNCKSGSIASGGTRSHCSCDICF